MWRILMWWVMLGMFYWRFFRPRKIVPELDLNWVHYAASWTIPMLVSIAGTYGLFGLTTHRFKLILIRDGLFMALLVMIDYFYGDVLPN
jgi:hypothetical protein